MALRYSASAPVNYLIDDTNHFVRVDPAAFQAAKAAATSGVAAPAPATSAAPASQATSVAPTTSTTKYYQMANRFGVISPRLMNETAMRQQLDNKMTVVKEYTAEQAAGLPGGPDPAQMGIGNQAPAPAAQAASTARPAPPPPPTAPAAPTASAAPTAVSSTDYKTQRDFLVKYGIDPSYVSAMSDAQVGGLYAMSIYQDMQARADAKIAPASLSATEMDQYLADAKTAVDPTFAVNLDVARQEINQALGQLSGDVAYASSQREQAITDEQKAQAQQMAEAGLAFSGLRTEAETKLKSQEQGLIKSEASRYQQQLQDMAGNYQKQYGTEALQALNIPALSFAGVNIPAPTPYNIPKGFGNQEQAQKISEIQKQQELEQTALQQKTDAQTYNFKSGLL